VCVHACITGCCSCAHQQVIYNPDLFHGAFLVSPKVRYWGTCVLGCRWWEVLDPVLRVAVAGRLAVVDET